MIYVSSDWHGYAPEKIKELLKKANFGPDDYLFVLGDVIDRGPHGIELLKYIMYEPNIELIRGNHEDLMLSCSFLLDEITDESLNALDARSISSYNTWYKNGGCETINAILKESPEMRQDILRFVSETPLYDTVSVGERDFILVHGGLGRNAYGHALMPEECSEFELLWNRPQPGYRYFEDILTIIGHTPTICYGPQYKGRIFKTDTWWNIDTGAAGGFPPMLLCLDDLTEYYLEK